MEKKNLLQEIVVGGGVGGGVGVEGWGLPFPFLYDPGRSLILDNILLVSIFCILY